MACPHPQTVQFLSVAKTQIQPSSNARLTPSGGQVVCIERYRLPTQAPAARPGAQKAASAGVLVFSVVSVSGAQQGREPARSRRLWHRAVCAATGKARLSEFPWHWAEASKQLGERVTKPSSFLPGGLAGCPLFIHSGVMSGSGQQPQFHCLPRLGILTNIFETRSHVAPAGLELTVWMRMTLDS